MHRVRQVDQKKKKKDVGGACIPSLTRWIRWNAPVEDTLFRRDSQCLAALASGLRRDHDTKTVEVHALVA